MKIFTNTILLLFFAHLCLEAQQLPTYTLYRENWTSLNPAFLTTNYLFGEYPSTLQASYRRQWVGIGPDAPWTGLTDWEYVIEEMNIGTGATFIHDQTGKIGQTGLYGRFNYRIDLGRRRDHFINVGLNAGVVQYRAKISQIEFAQVENRQLEDDNVIMPDFALGVFYYYDEKFYAGLSVPQTFGLNTRFRTEGGEFRIDRQQHFYLMGGGYINIFLFGSDAAYLEPTVFVRYVSPNVPLGFDVSVRCQFSDIFWVGIGGGPISQTARFDVGVVIGEALNFYNGQFKLGFGYDVPLGPYRSGFGNGLEFTAIYSWDSYY